MTWEKHHALLLLLHADRLGRRGVLELMERFGSFETAVSTGWNEGTRTLFDRWQVGEWEKEADRIEKERVLLISYLEENYPKPLLQLIDFPLLLYVKGNLTAADSRGLALIGTRNATLYGKQMAVKIAKELGEQGVTVISGLARGIDTAAHLGALEGGGRTIAFVGSGLGHIYPKENHPLAEKIAQQGAVISECPMATQPAKWLFPRRNRLVSALSLGVCLIESPLEGGGMITMRLGQEHKKKLFALPGRVDYPSFEGNHALIKEGRAQLVEHGSDLLKALQFAIKESKPSCSIAFSEEEKRLLHHLCGEEKSVEQLVLLTQFPIMQLNVLLTRLILKKAVIEFPGKVYKSRVDGKSTNHR